VKSKIGEGMQNERPDPRAKSLMQLKRKPTVTIEITIMNIKPKDNFNYISVAEVIK
jgi:hypothetical protein